MLSVSDALSYQDAIGIGRKGTIDNPYILKAPFWTVDTLFYCVPKDTDLNFLYGLYQTINWRSMDESTGVPSLSKTAINDVDVSIPSMNEQQMIGDAFHRLDNLITLHQYKFFLPQTVYLDIKYPPITILNTAAWKQRKVIDVAEIVAGGTPSITVSSYWNPKEIPWLSSGEVHKKYITYTDNMISKEGMNNSSAKMVPENSVLIALAGQGKTRGTVAINRIPLTTNQSIAAMTFDDDIVPEFVFCNLEGRYDELRKMSSGDGTRGGLNKQLIGDIVIPYTNKEEQQLIGSCFTELDNLITLHQRKCDELKEVKKYMLQNMFPQKG